MSQSAPNENPLWSSTGMSRRVLLRRDFLRGGVAVTALAVAASALSACQQAAPASPTAAAAASTSATAPTAAKATTAAAPTTAAAKPTAASAAPTAGTASSSQQTMVGAFDMGPGGCPQCWDPRKRTAGYTWLVKLWAPLVIFDKSMTKLEPELAEKWQGDSSAKVWTVQLRKGLKWSDGQPLTANDVYYQYKVLFSKELAGAYTSGLLPQQVEGGEAYFNGTATDISGIKVVNDTTVEFHLVNPDALFPRTLVVGIEFAEHFYKKYTMKDIAGGAMFKQPRPCSGPFVWSKYVEDQYLETTANPYYWRGKPKLDKLINRYFPAESTAVLSLKRDEIQFTYFSGDVLSSLEQTASLSVIKGPSFVANFLAYNFRDPSFADLRVRQAIMQAIDRDTIIKTLFKGAAQKINSLFWEPSYLPSNLIDYPYDPKKAQALLKAANWKQNGKWDMISYYSDQLSQNIMQAIQQYLAVVGINVVPRTMDVPTFNNIFPSGKGWTIGYIGAADLSVVDILPRWYNGADPQAAGSCKTPFGCYPNINEITKLMDDVRHNVDVAKQNKDMQQITSLMNKQLPNGYMWMSQRYGAFNKKVKNFVWTPAPAGGPYYDQAELWEISS